MGRPRVGTSEADAVQKEVGMMLGGGICKFTARPCRSVQQVSRLGRYITQTSDSRKLGVWTFGLGAGSEKRSHQENVAHFARLAESLGQENRRKQTTGQPRLADQFIVMLGDSAVLDEERLRRIAVRIRSGTLLRDHAAIVGAHEEVSKEGVPYVALHFQFSNAGFDGKSLAGKRSNAELFKLYKQVQAIVQEEGIALDASTEKLEPFAKNKKPEKGYARRRQEFRAEMSRKIGAAIESSDSLRAFRAALEAAGLTCKTYRGKDGMALCSVRVPRSKFHVRTDRLEGLAAVQVARVTSWADSDLRPRDEKKLLKKELAGRDLTSLLQDDTVFAVTVIRDHAFPDERVTKGKNLIGIKREAGRVVFIDANRGQLMAAHAALLSAQGQARRVKKTIAVGRFCARALGISLKVLVSIPWLGIHVYTHSGGPRGGGGMDSRGRGR